MDRTMGIPIPRRSGKTGFSFMKVSFMILTSHIIFKVTVPYVKLR